MIQEGRPHFQSQQSFNQLLPQFCGDRKIDTDVSRVSIVWAKNPGDVTQLLRDLRDKLGMSFLADLTAYDNVDQKDGTGRFVVVYQLLNLKTHARVRVKVLAGEKDEIPTAVPLWASADWLEREVFDMFGIRFKGHPDLRRILMDERFIGYPLRKEYDIRHRQSMIMPLPARMKDSHVDLNGPGHDHDEARQDLKDFFNPNVMLNMGPSHPAMHGTLRVMCRVNGEVIEDANCEMGYLHRAIEKLGETKTYHQWLVYTDRLNYCSALTNNIGHCMAVENLLDLKITDRCMWVRIICMELSRIIDHIICVAINALDMGAMTIFWHMYVWREEAYTMIEGMCGMRLTTTYARIGGMSYDLPVGFEGMMSKFLDGFMKTIDEVERLLTRNRIWVDRTRDVNVISAETALRFSMTGPCLRASQVDYDIRRDQPYYAYDDLEFDIPIGTKGDVYDRYLCRMEEMRQSVRILKQCMKRLPGGPIWVDDRRVHIPDKNEVYTKMEVLIHHFKIFMEGIDVPPGETYTTLESPNGELGFYIVSRGGPKAWRLRVRSPSFFHYQILEETIRGEKIPDAVAALGSVNIIAGELDR